MNRLIRIVPLLLALTPLVANSKEETPIDFFGEIEASNPVKISDGSSVQKSAPIPFQVEASNTRKIYIKESPEMPGLPAPEGLANITVQLVKDPGLSDPLPPLPALPPNDPAVLARMAELQKTYQETHMVFVSATVYDHSRTLLRCYPSGAGERKEITLWSNLDFNHFSGFSTFQIKSSDGEIREYGLMMSISNEDSQQAFEWQEKHDKKLNSPKIPKLPELSASGPAFFILEGDAEDQEAMELVEGMHDLYRVEGKRMKEAYQARIKAYEKRRSELLKKAPRPKDVTIRFWNRENVKANESNSTEGK